MGTESPPGVVGNGEAAGNVLWARQDARRIATWLLTAWIGCMLAGTFALRHPGVMVSGQELSADRAVFLSINAGTLTGFQQAVGSDQFSPYTSRGPAIVLLLVCAGSLFSMICGSMALVRILKLNYSLAQVVRGALAALALATVGGAVVLIGPNRSLYESTLQSAAAFSNCGIASTHVTSIYNVRTYLLLAMAALGGLGLPVLMEAYDRLWFRRPLSKHAWTSIRFAAGTYLVGFILLLILQWPGSRVPFTTWQQVLASSSVEAVNSRTAGMHFEPLGILPRAAQWVLILMMAIGAGSAGTGGGLKSTTVVQLWIGVRETLAGRKAGRSFGVAAVWVGMYVVLVVSAFVVLLALEGDVAADRIFFEVVSAASNVGLSHEPVNATGAGLWLLSAVMLAGRIAPLATLWWMAETTSGSELGVG